MLPPGHALGTTGTHVPPRDAHEGFGVGFGGMQHETPTPPPQSPRGSTVPAHAPGATAAHVPPREAHDGLVLGTQHDAPTCPAPQSETAESIVPFVQTPGTTAAHVPPFAAQVGKVASGAGVASADASGDASGEVSPSLDEQAMAVRVEATKRREKKVFIPG